MGMNRAEEEDFTAFVHERGDRLLRFARLLVPDRAEAEDVLQAALLRLTRHWDKQLASPEAYVRTTLVNLAKDRGKRKHLVPSPSDHSQGPHPSSPDLADGLVARAELDHLLKALPPRQRVTVVLRVLDGLSEAETAELLGCSVGAVKSNLSRGLDKVRESLDPEIMRSAGTQT